MDPTFNALLKSWELDPWLLVTLGLSSLFYARGWLHYRRRLPRRFGRFQLVTFHLGLIALFLALASPVEAAARLLLFDHMIQHLLLMMLAPPLLLLGAPVLPMVRGMPRVVRVELVGPFPRSRSVRRLFRALTYPPVAWLVFVLSTWCWHIPRVYELALTSNRWHYFEHGVFFATAMLFWWPVVQPYPSRAVWSRWLMIPYLLAADLQNTLLSALFAFSGRVLYPHYEAVPRLWGISAIEDQAIAGAVMWIPGSVAYLVPVAWIGARLLYGRSSPKESRAVRRVTRRRETVEPIVSLPILNASYSEPPPGRSATVWRMSRVPAIGRFLGWRYARAAVQVPMLALALLVVADGFWGPRAAPMNLAGVLPWTHWRGLVVFGLLIVGNLFCFACPFTLPRRLLHRRIPPGREWPRMLKNKWLALGLLLLFFWAYEVFALWSDPVLTASLILVYFLAAFIVDSWFKAGSFCKYVCPIGQFHFFQSLVSPFEIRARDSVICHSCVGKECIRGSAQVPGCELGLFLPRKVGNFDCTLCLDCVHACPHDNVGIVSQAPGRTLLADPVRSGIGRLSQRADLACLALVLAFSAFANAAGMVGPVVDGQDAIARAWGVSESWIITLTYLGSVAGACLLFVLAAALGNRIRGEAESWRESLSRQAHALVPLGASMWLVHFAFHFLTSHGTWLPVVQRFAGDLGLGLGEPEWTSGCCVEIPPWLPRLEIFFLDLGLLGSLYLGFKHSEANSESRSRTFWGFLPLALVLMGTFGWGIWIVLQPMQMRGTMLLLGG